MPTTKQLVESSLRSINVLADGEEATPSQVQDALVSAKMMLDSWSLESLMVGAIVSEEFTLDAKRDHTIGEALADFITVRPIDIVSARYRDPAGYEQPVQLVTLNVWESISWKDSQEPFPAYIYYESAYPLGVLHSSAINTAGYKLIINSLKQIADLPELTAEMDFQTGMHRVIKYGLAIELWEDYWGTTANPPITLVEKFKVAKTNIKRINSKNRSSVLKVDDGLKVCRSSNPLQDIYSR